MSDRAQLEAMAERLRQARDRLRTVPVSDSHQVGPPDAKTGERWDRFNVLGHTAEMLPFWSRDLGFALSGDGQFGRAPGSADRVHGIESGRLMGEAALRERIDQGVEAALGLLAGLIDADLERKLTGSVRGEQTLRQALETYLVGHFEEHVGQLAELPPV